MGKSRMRDVVILVPGIMGSVLQRHGQDAWAISGQAFSRALLTRTASIRELTLHDDDPEMDDVGDGVKATRIFPDAHLVPGLVRVDGYSRIRQMVLDKFDVALGTFTEPLPGDIRLDTAGTFFEFPYDWRRDNRVSARRLQRLVTQALAARRKLVPDAKVILLAHSMGGLVSRYFLECLGGWRDCRALVTFGTPYRGSVQAIEYLANGFRKIVELGFIGEMARSFTAIYQLLPIYKALCVEGEWQRVAEAYGVPNIDRAKAADALAFHREIEQAVSQREEANRVGAYTLIPFVGTAQTTALSAHMIAGNVTTSFDLPVWMQAELGEGDGTVPRPSAIPLEMKQAMETYLAVRHGSIQRHPQVLDDLRHRLARMQAPELGAIRAPGALGATERPDLTLDVDDVFARDEPVRIEARIHGDSGHLGALVATIGRAEGSAKPAVHPMIPTGSAWRVQASGLSSGLYRVEVSAKPGGPHAPLPVQELFAVAE